MSLPMVLDLLHQLQYYCLHPTLNLNRPEDFHRSKERKKIAEHLPWSRDKVDRLSRPRDLAHPRRYIVPRKNKSHLFLRKNESILFRSHWNDRHDVIRVFSRRLEMKKWICCFSIDRKRERERMCVCLQKDACRIFLFLSSIYVGISKEKSPIYIYLVCRSTNDD